jgi:hypothetical protein
LARSTVRKPARNLAACVKSQAAGVERFIPLGGGIVQEGVEARTGFRVRDPAFPRLVLLTGEEKSGKVRQLGLFVRRESLADLNNLCRGAADGHWVIPNRIQFKQVRRAVRPRFWRVWFGVFARSAQPACSRLVGVPGSPPPALAPSPTPPPAPVARPAGE